MAGAVASDDTISDSAWIMTTAALYRSGQGRAGQGRMEVKPCALTRIALAPLGVSGIGSSTDIDLMNL